MDRSAGAGEDAPSAPRRVTIPAAPTEEAVIRRAYEGLTRRLIREGLTISTMESCTSGQIASLLTDTEGASAVLKEAFITYSNEAKIRRGVSAQVIETFGVYSAQTAAAMAAAARRNTGADIGLGVTGSFGNPDPNNPDSVPGLVFFAIDFRGNVGTFRCELPLRPSRLAWKLTVAEAVADALAQALAQA